MRRLLHHAARQLFQSRGLCCEHVDNSLTQDSLVCPRLSLPLSVSVSPPLHLLLFLFLLCLSPSLEFTQTIRVHTTHNTHNTNTNNTQHTHHNTKQDTFTTLSHTPLLSLCLSISVHTCLSHPLSARCDRHPFLHRFGLGLWRHLFALHGTCLVIEVRNPDMMPTQCKPGSP